MLEYEKVLEKQKFKEMNSKGKFEHVREYYRWHIISGIFAIIVVFSMLNHFVFNPPKTSSCQIMAIAPYADQEKTGIVSQIINKELPELNTDRKEVMFNTLMLGGQDGDPQRRMASQQKLTAMIVAKELDIIIANVDSMKSEFAKQGILLNLDDIYTEEEIKAMGYEPIRGKVDDDVADGDEELKEEHMYAVDITSNSELNNLVFGDDLGIGIAINSEKPEAAKKVLDYLLKEKLNIEEFIKLSEEKQAE